MEMTESMWDAVVAILKQKYPSITRKKLQGMLDNAPNDTYLTTNEVCDTLRVSRMTVYRLEKEGHLHPSRIGSKLLFSRNELDSLLEKMGTV